MRKIFVLLILISYHTFSQLNFNITNLNIDKYKISFCYNSDRDLLLKVINNAKGNPISTIKIPSGTHPIVINNLEPSTEYFLKFYNIYNNGFDSIKLYTQSNYPSTINVYFNKKVDTTIAKIEKAKGEIDFAQKLINRIDSAKYSVDLCVYSFSGSVGDAIADALINAKNRGVKIRFIIEEDNKDRAPVRKLINAGVPVLTDKCGSNDGTGLQHNKFFIFDNRDNSSELDDLIISGSWNPTEPGTFDDFQNIVEIQNKSLASAYTTEFEEMWGSNSDNYDVTKAKFGKNKTDNTPHLFIIDGINVELYFSPTDKTLNRLIDIIKTARNSINFSEMTFTNDDAANAIKLANSENKVTVRGIMNKEDAETATGSKYTFFNSSPKWCTVLKSNYPTGIFHHKYMIIDGENINSNNAWLITGSYNITNSAEYYNNENLLFFKSLRLADIYLQEFVQRFKECGGIYTNINNTLYIPETFSLEQNYPNPFNSTIKIKFSIKSEKFVNLKIYDVLGNEIENPIKQDLRPGNYEIVWNASNLPSGVYYYTLKYGNELSTKKMILIK